MKGKHMLDLICRNTKLYLKHHSSTILTCIGAIGVIGTSVMAVKATPKALKLIGEATDEKGEELTKLEIVRVAAPAYIPSVVIGIGTISCIFGANVLNKQKQAAITSAYMLVDRAYKDYRNKVKELLGEETDIQIREAIAKDKRDEDITGFVPGLGSLGGDGEKYLFYEENRGKYFEATMSDVLNAEYHLNRNFALRGFATLNEFYSFLGMEPTEFGEVLGWEFERLSNDYDAFWIDFGHRVATVAEDGLKCYVIDMVFPPTVIEDL